MNKKELKDAVRKIVLLGRNATKVRDELMQAVDQLDEPEKVKAPKWFAEWIETYSGIDRYTLLRVMWSNFYEEKYTSEQRDWILLNTEVAQKAILYGCKPIEPLYIMPVPYSKMPYWYIYLLEYKKIDVTMTKKMASHFTAAEIEEYFPKIKEFAEEVTS